MNFVGLLFLLLTHFITGKGLIRLCRVQLSAIAMLCFSMLGGVFIASLVPCVMQLVHVPFTAGNLYTWLGAATVLFSIPLLLNIRNTKPLRIKLPELYELPFIIVFLGIAAISVWRCYYYPVVPRDMLTGPELIAEYAVREKTMLNSVYTTDLRMHPDSANNIFKSPFITSLQIIYKLLVHPFGQQWLSVVFLSFTLWFYTTLRSRIHPFLACVLLLIFLSVPDLFAYTYLILYDYSNMVFFCASLYFMAAYLDSGHRVQLLWACLLMGIATYIRAETLIIVGLFCPLLVLHYVFKRTPFKRAALSIGTFIAVPFLFDILCSTIFIKNLIPLHYDVGRLINNPFDIVSFLRKLYDMAAVLIFSHTGILVYGLFYVFFAVVLLADVIWPRRYNREAKLSLIAIAIIYAGLAVIAYLIKSVSIENTIKRGLFRILPIMVWYMANSGILQRLSDFIKMHELAKTPGKGEDVVLTAETVPDMLPNPDAQ